MANESKRSVTKELKREILWTLDDLHLVSPTKVVVNSKGQEVEIPDKEFEGLVEKLDKLLSHDEERRKEQLQLIQIAVMAGTPFLLLGLGWGGRVLIQSPYWKDIVRAFEKIVIFRR